MCDPFNPEWQKALDNHCAKHLQKYMNDPDCIGIFSDNEINMFDLTRYVYSKHAVAAFIEFLKSRHASAAKLNIASLHGHFKLWEKT